MTEKMTPRPGETLRRLATLDRATVDTEDRTVELSFSSEIPVERFFGLEILDHNESSVDLSTFNEPGAAPLLADHENRLDAQLGTVVSARIDTTERKGRATVRFRKNARAQEALDAVAEGDFRNVSIGYQVLEVREEGKRDGREVVRVTKWRPFEISLVAAPADATVGIGRQAAPPEPSPSPSPDNPAQETREPKEVKDMPNEPTPTPAPEERAAPAPAHPAPDLDKIRNDARAAERRRVSDIMALATKHNRSADGEKFVIEGKSIEEFRGWLLDQIAEGTPLVKPASDLGLNEREVKDYSLLRLARAVLNKQFRSGAPFEFELSDEIAKNAGRTARGVFLPYDIVGKLALGRRDVQKGVAADGGNLVGTIHDAGNFIELLRNRAMVARLGARMLPGLVGDLSIPTHTGGASAFWIAEGSTTTESTPQFGTVALTPNTVSGRVDITRKMLLQSSPAIEGLVVDDLLATLALEIDRAAINGSGTGAEPEGILNATGIGDVSMGTPDGGAPSWGGIVELETDVAAANADDGALGYLTNAVTRGKLKTTEKASNTAQFIWPDGRNADGFGEMNGYRAAVSNQVPSNLVEGASGATLSAIIFGNWNDLLIGEWGVLDVKFDEVTLGDSGGVVMRAFQDVDVALRHVESFSASQDVVTT